MNAWTARLAMAAVLCAIVLAARAEEQAWPAKPVRLVSPFAPGGSSDTIGRLLADQLSRKFGQQFYVENRAGAAGLIGSAAVANAAPDGYTFLIASVGTHATVPAVNASVGYDPVRSFTHVAYLGGPPTVIAVHPSLGARTFAAFAALAKKSSTPIAYVSPGPGTVGNLIAELWAHNEGVKLAHVAYKGSGQAINDLVAGHVQLGSLTWSAAVEQIRAGTIVGLAVSSTDRLSSFPEVPTLKELGYRDLVATTWFGISAPAALPAGIVTRMHQAIAEVLRTPALKTRLALEGIETEDMSPQQYTAFIASELARWGPIAHQLASVSADK
jgi:tripartite-type tricarboxylate transporter receptor subunit TctC